MKMRYFYIIVGVIVIVMFVFGMVVGDQCAEIDGCRACWSTVDVTVTSELCPNPAEPCRAEPYLQQHNAMVDMILCACAKAEAEYYANSVLNRQIEDVIKIMTNYTLTAYQLCEEPGVLLTKRRYE